MRHMMFLFLIALLLTGVSPHVQHHPVKTPAFDVEEHVQLFSADKAEYEKMPFSMDQSESSLVPVFLAAAVIAALSASAGLLKKFLLSVFYQSSYYGHTSLRP
ncbi:hypothetical protein WKH31_02600 [Metabacillus indicus]|uniref:hypothetical protein n=1 Tax=Metabacillus indicus TaxID=246786 RepID=UPI003181FE02